jgi:hypothetical protein
VFVRALSAAALAASCDPLSFRPEPKPDPSPDRPCLPHPRTEAPWDSVSAAAKDCVRSMMTWHASRRPTARDLLAHEWIRSGGGCGPASPVPAPPPRWPAEAAAAAAATLATPLLPPGGARRAGAGGRGAAGGLPDHELLRRLRAFAARPPLQRAGALVVAKCLPFDELRGLQELFQSVDDDGDAAITAYELQRVGADDQSGGVHLGARFTGFAGFRLPLLPAPGSKSHARLPPLVPPPLRRSSSAAAAPRRPRSRPSWPPPTPTATARWGSTSS